MIILSGPDVSHGVVVSSFMRVWLVGLFCFYGPVAETQMRSKCYLSLSKILVSVAQSPNALFLR